MSVRGVNFDVREATGPVTVMVEIEAEGPNLAFLTGPDVKTSSTRSSLASKQKRRWPTVRTRGTDDQTKMATLTITEGFKGAFEVLTELEVEVSGLPGGVELGIVAEPNDDGDENENENLHMAEVAPGKLTGDKDGDDKSSTITLGMDTENAMVDAMSVPSEVTLMLTLTSTDDAMTPLDVGMITAKVTFKGDAFEDAFTDAATIFEIRRHSARCCFRS